MPHSAALTITVALRVAEWRSTRLKSYVPLAADNDLTGQARLMEHRWLYVFGDTTPVPGSTLAARTVVAAELYVKHSGLVVFVSNSVELQKPIPERPTLDGSVDPTTLTLAYHHADTSPIRYRLIASRFRLSRGALKDLLHHWGAIKRIVPQTWGWKFPSSYETKLLSAGEALHLDEDHTVVRDNGVKHRVVVAIEPFEIAEALSDEYGLRLTEYGAEFEPSGKEERKKLERLTFGKLLLDVLAKKQGGGYTLESGVAADLGRGLVAEVEAFERHRMSAVRAREIAALRLCRFFGRRLMRIFIDAALDAEGLEGQEISQPLAEFHRMLGYATRSLNSSPTGQALLRHWAESAERSDRHFINRAVLPNQVISEQHFKTLRHSSKSLASLLLQFVTHRVAVMRKLPAKYMADTVVGLFGNLSKQLGAAEFKSLNHYKRDLARHISEIDVRGASGPLRPGSMHVTFKLGMKDPISVKVPYFAPLDQTHLEQWVDAGEPLTRAKDSGALSAKLKVGLLMDAINLAFAAAAVTEADTAVKRAETVSSAVALSFGIAATLVESRLVAKHLRETTAKGIAIGFRIVAGGLFAFWNADGAWRSIRRGNLSRAVAYGVAALAEVTGVVGNILLFSVSFAPFAAWIIVVAGAIAAGAYIALAYLDETPMQEFLSNCEWGNEPYSLNAMAPTSTWKYDQLRSRFQEQGTIFIRLLATLYAKRVSYLSQEGVVVTCSFVPQGFSLKGRWNAELQPSGAGTRVALKQHAFDVADEKLRALRGGGIKFKPPSAWFSGPAPVQLRFEATLADPDGEKISYLRFDSIRDGREVGFKVRHASS